MKGKKKVKVFEGVYKVKSVDSKSISETASDYNFKMYADSCTCPVSSSSQKDSNVRRESGTPTTTYAET